MNLNKKGIKSYRITGETPNDQAKMLVQEVRAPTGVQASSSIPQGCGGVALRPRYKLVIFDKHSSLMDQEQVEKTVFTAISRRVQ